MIYIFWPFITDIILFYFIYYYFIFIELYNLMKIENSKFNYHLFVHLWKFYLLHVIKWFWICIFMYILVLFYLEIYILYLCYFYFIYTFIYVNFNNNTWTHGHTMHLYILLNVGHLETKMWIKHKKVVIGKLIFWNVA